MAYEPDEDPFAQEYKKGPHNLDPVKIDNLLQTVTVIASNFALARVRVNEGLGPGAHLAYSSAAHLVHDLNRQLGLRADLMHKPRLEIPREGHLQSDRLRAAATGATRLRTYLLAADGIAMEGKADDAYIVLGDAHNVLKEIAIAMGFRLVWAPELVPSQTAFASAGAGGAVTGGRP